MRDRSTKAVSTRLRILAFAVALGAPGPLAAEAIGTANTVHPDVSGAGSTIKNGDGVTQGEVIKSGPKGSTKIGFNDGTSLSIGSSAQVTLSHFVFADKKTFKKATLDLGKGVFRFVTGSSDKKAYEIKTPTSTISVRGTDITVTVTANGTKVDVQSGSVEQSNGNSSSDPGEGLSDTTTTVTVHSGSVSFCQGSSCQNVDAGQTASDHGGSQGADPTTQPNTNPPPAPPSPQPYTPQNQDNCNSIDCSTRH